MKCFKNIYATCERTRRKCFLHGIAMVGFFLCEKLEESCFFFVFVFKKTKQAGQNNTVLGCELSKQECKQKG